MIPGFNTEFKCRGKVYHVQTEDNGLSNPFIITLLYHQGAIFASRKTGYEDKVSTEDRDKVISKMMKEQHKKMIKDVLDGAFETNGEKEAAAGIAETEKVSVEEIKVEEIKEEEVEAEDVIPPQPKKKEKKKKASTAGPVDPSTKTLDQLIMEYLAQELDQSKSHRQS